MSVFDPIRRYADLVKMAAWGVLAVSLLGLGFYVGFKWQASKVADLKLGHAETLREIAEETAKAAQLTRIAEQAQAVAFADVDQLYQESLNHARESTFKDVLAGLNSGAIRLRGPWACPLPGPATASASARESESDAEDRAESAGRIVRAAAECDAQVTGLQSILAAEREPRN